MIRLDPKTQEAPFNSARGKAFILFFQSLKASEVGRQLVNFAKKFLEDKQQRQKNKHNHTIINYNYISQLGPI